MASRMAETRHPLIDPLALGVATLLGAALVSAIIGIRIPEVHDEFAYLLAAETFASGRLTNPTPRFWEHLEGFHVLMTPTYTGKYPPGQAMAISLGIVLGHPILGVWLSVAFMVSATTWMLGALLPRRWATAGGLLMLLQLGVASSWAQTYWGGAVAAGAGALLYGALFRAWRAPGAGAGSVMGLGLILLANSRPLEGFVVSLPALAALVRLSASSPAGPRLRLWAGLVPILLLGSGAMAAYNHAVVGSATRMPYQEYQAQYGSAPVLVTAAPRVDVPEYRHQEFDDFWREWGRERHAELRAPGTFVSSRIRAAARIVFSYLGLASLGLLYLKAVLQDPRHRLAGLGILLGSTITLMSIGAYPHYLAPAAPLFVLLAIAGWRIASERVSAWFRRFAFAACVAALWVPPTQVLFNLNRGPNSFQVQREETAACLAGLPSPSLVLVDYQGPFQHRGEWVRNGPSPWSSHIVWARAMGPDLDTPMIEAESDRAVWSAVIDSRDPEGPRFTLSLLRGPVSGPGVSELGICALGS